MSLSRLIRSCAEKNSIFNGRAVHARLIISGSDPDVQTNNHLLTMYSKLGHIDYAEKLFDRMPVRNLVTWTSLISAYSQMGLSDKALNCFRSLVLDDGISPNDYTYVAAISACAQAGALRNGKEIHGRIYRTEETFNSFVNNCLVNFYGKCKSLKSARLVFDTMPEPNTVSCVSLVASYIQCGENEEGLRIFLRLLRMGVKVNEYCYGSILGCCAALETLEVGRQVQCLAVKCGVRMDQFVVTSLVNFYAKCGELELASRALREADKPNVTAWTALIGGCVQLGKCRLAIGLFRDMLSAGLKPSEQTFASVLGAFGREKEIQAGSVNSGRHEVAIRYIQNMLSEGFDPDIYTYSSLLSICGDLPATEWGKQTHCRVIKPGLDSNVVVGSAVIDMYAKCGRLDDARNVFDALPNKNLVSWNAMITGYAQHGFGREALEIYDVMLNNGVKPNDVTFIGVLSSCGHVGALEEALHHFGSMMNDYGISPRTDHLGCIVSLFARKGQTKAAYDFIRSFPGEPNKVVWRSLLSGCVSNKELDLAIYAAEKVLSVDPNDTSARVMLSNIYADSNMWNEASHVRKIMEGKAIKKEIGYSWT
ncbi:hypothetical protein DH2020_021454 [Rehmannia glutinosa]|uniref:Pentatricopeptide repeat-containing protein n=1 Tax=Rehmannia glutinosa TaxID=99300 RepID=A0ABR0WEY4_REHGL